MPNPFRSMLFRTLAALGVCLLLGGCPFTPWDDGWNDDDDSSAPTTASGQATPVYLTYQELRSAVKVEDPRPLTDIGRVYLFGDYFFLNEKNTGVHVYDNRNPATPVAARFINIPGNTELAIKGGYLYADSYVDLVTLDLNDPDNIQEVGRQESVFPWDEYQNVPDTVYFYDNDIDENVGVIVGYQ